MPYGRTTYAGNEGQTETSQYGGGGGGQRGGGDMSGPMGWLFQLAGRRANQKLQEQQEALAIQREQAQLDADMKREQLKLLKSQGRAASGQGLSLADQNVLHAQRTAAIAKAGAEAEQARALSGRAPLRTTHIMGAVPFLSHDINKMTGAQRQVFLPGGNAMIGGGGGGAGGASRMDASGARGDEFYDSLFHQRMMDMQGAGGGFGSTSDVKNRADLAAIAAARK